MRKIIRTTTIIISCTIAFASTAGGQDDSRRSPFEYIRWKDVTPEVKVQGKFYQLVAVNAIPLDELFDQCRKMYLEKWKKRFDEDLDEVLDELDQPAGATVALTVRDLASGEETVIKDVALTAANRDSILQSKYGDIDQSDWIVGTPKVQREHLTVPDPRFEQLAKRLESDKEWAAEKVNGDKAIEDLDDLEWHLANRFSYLTRKNVDYKAAIDTLRLGVGEGISRGALAIQIMKLLALFGDGNTRLDRWSDIHSNHYVPWVMFMPARYAPFLMDDVDGRVAACTARPKGLFAAEFPYVKSLDGVDINDWLSAARRIVPDASPQFVRNLAPLYGMFIGFVRAELGISDDDSLSVELMSADGAQVKRLTLPVEKAPPLPDSPPLIEARRMPGDIGYLQLSKMEDNLDYFNRIFDAMKSFRDTKGLIIDVRDNKGGSREALRVLFPFFMERGETPFVANVAAYRLPPGRDWHRKEGYLADQACYPPHSEYWNDAERAAIERFARDFAPKRPLTEGQFSDWHYFVLSPRKSSAYYQYTSPVVVLMNNVCFGSTDVFLGAFKGRRHVTLMGTPSGGGNGRAINSALLLNSGLRIQFSSMVSFLPDGRLYDGEGIAPDVVVKPSPTDVAGVTDSLLEAAVGRLRQ